MNDPADTYLRYFKAIQAIEDVFDFVCDRTDLYNGEIERFRNRLENVTDDTIKMAAEVDWTHAFMNSGIQSFWADYEEFVERHFKPYFETGRRGGFWKR